MRKLVVQVLQMTLLLSPVCLPLDSLILSHAVRYRNPRTSLASFVETRGPTRETESDVMQRLHGFTPRDSRTAVLYRACQRIERLVGTAASSAVWFAYFRPACSDDADGLASLEALGAAARDASPTLAPVQSGAPRLVRP
ncbi:hypothetical protein CMUS01_15591 [Colletotrichum musicola]|uniref:Secreted protein n=1 Tax=Colletotrichum musicola TaxID=2175873 RepID=A0A8H6MMQ0_9PEZI|nr:hypothetical protein CMUS01_15591 [Colletotrichum musicola]